MDIVNELAPHEIEYWDDFPLHQVVKMNPPAGMENCSPCAAILTQNNLGERIMRVAWKPNELDVAALAQGGTIWLSCWGGLLPHSLEVQQPPDVAVVALEVQPPDGGR